MEQCSFQCVQKKTSSMSVTISSSASPQRELSSSASSQRELSSSASSQRELSSFASSQRELSSSASSQRKLSSSASSQRELSSSASSQRELSSSASSQRELSSQAALSSSVFTSSGPLSSVVTSSGPLSSSSASVLTQRHSDLLQSSAPYSPQSAPYSPQCSSSRGAPSFVKTLHDVSSVKGQLVVLECRLRGTPPLQVLWYREDEQILDSDDFRILRKKASSASVPEELCTLVITEAFPEDSGLYRCVALNSYGSVSCSSVLEVYNDLEEQLEMEALRQQESAPGPNADPGPDLDLDMDPEPDPDPEWPESPPEDTLTSDFPDQSPEDSERSEVTVREATPTPPPPPSPPAKSKEKKLFTPSKLSFTSGSSTMNLSDLPTFSPSSFPSTSFNYERPRHFIQSQPAFQVPSYDSVLQDSPPTSSPPLAPPTASPPLSPAVSSSHSSIAVSKSSAETGAVLQVSHSHASQTQSHASLTQSHTSQMQVCQSETRSFTQTQSQFQSMSLSELQSNGTSVALPSSVAPPPSQAPPSLLLSCSSPLPRPRVRSSLTLTPSSPSASVGLGSASLPANQESASPVAYQLPTNQDAAPAAAYLCSVLPGSKSPSRSPLMPNRMAPPLTPNVMPLTPKATPLSPKTTPLSPTTTPFSPTATPLIPTATAFSPTATSLTPTALPRSQQQNMQNLNRVQPTVVSLPASYKATPTILPKPILKKTIAPRPSSARSTDDDIQGSKDALIQDLEKKLRSKEARRRTGQKLSYEERMARRLLGHDSATYMFDQELLDSVDQPDSLEGRHIGGLWGRHHSAADEKTNEGSAIQEKCYAPRFLQIPPDLTVEEGRFCRIDFKVGGLPTPDVCWYLDGKAIRPDDYHKMLVCEKGMHSFIIEIVTVHHAGVYECVAQNRAGESRFSMRLDVIAQEALRPPTFVQKMLNSRALEGDTVRLECKVDASPPPQLFWKKDKDMLRIDPQRMSLYQDGSGRQCLLIERVVKPDAGWYTLSAINEAGMSTCNARLDISSRSTPPMKTVPPASKTLKLLSSLSHVPLNADGPSQHTAPLYESEEL